MKEKYYPKSIEKSNEFVLKLFIFKKKNSNDKSCDINIKNYLQYKS
jgi:hypothetical protein